MAVEKFSAEIDVRPGTRLMIYRMFEGPKKLKELLAKEDDPPKDDLGIRLFLLKHKVSLYPFIRSDLHKNTDFLVAQTRGLIQQQDPEARLDFYGPWRITTEGRFSLPGQFGVVRFVAPDDQLVMRENAGRFNSAGVPGCSIISNGKVLILEFSLASSAKSAQPVSASANKAVAVTTPTVKKPKVPRQEKIALPATVAKISASPSQGLIRWYESISRGAVTRKRSGKKEDAAQRTAKHAPLKKYRNPLPVNDGGRKRKEDEKISCPAYTGQPVSPGTFPIPLTAEARRDRGIWHVRGNRGSTVYSKMAEGGSVWTCSGGLPGLGKRK